MTVHLDCIDMQYAQVGLFEESNLVVIKGKPKPYDVRMETNEWLHFLYCITQRLSNAKKIALVQ